MIQMTVASFLKKLPKVVHPRDHHFTGPPRYHQAENNGSVFHEEGLILTSLAASYGGPVLEIGTNLAISTRYISEGLDYFGSGEVHTIDINQWWQPDPEWPRIIPYHTPSIEYTPKFSQWAFVDGDHKAVGVFIDTYIALRCGCPKGILFHDCGPHLKGVSDAREVVPLAMPKDWTIYEILTGCGLMFAECLK